MSKSNILLTHQTIQSSSFCWLCGSKTTSHYLLLCTQNTWVIVNTAAGGLLNLHVFCTFTETTDAVVFLRRTVSKVTLQVHVPAVSSRKQEGKLSILWHLKCQSAVEQQSFLVWDYKIHSILFIMSVFACRLSSSLDCRKTALINSFHAKTTCKFS